MANFDDKGRQVPDPTPYAPTLQRSQEMTRDENIAMLVAREFSRLSQQTQDFESFEESMEIGRA